MRLCLFEDAAVTDLAPLSLTRPAFDLRCGAATLAERQQRLLPGAAVTVVVRPALAPLCRLEHPDWMVNDLDGTDEEILFVNARWLPPANPPVLPEGDVLGVCDGQVAFARRTGSGLRARWPMSLTGWDDRPHLSAGGTFIRYLWDLYEKNSSILGEDLVTWQKTRPETATMPSGAIVFGPMEQVRVDPTAIVEPQVVLDARPGPVLIDRGAVIRAFSRVQGPCYVGPDCHIVGGNLRGSSLGPACRVGGEVEASVLQGYCNKYHDGFLGHSVIGAWVNFGAGTQTSDLRNDYGVVQVILQGRKVDTGSSKVGCFLGDYTRTGIGALLNVGTVVGPFGQLLPSGTYLPRSVPAFGSVHMGRIQERTDLGPMFAAAAMAMGRRGQVWTETHADLFLDLYETTAAERRRLIREIDQKRMRRSV
jgi:UDP-N-acetylglucosamine diphosphorylase / glucose-1-phosphate thymidylyltransferase / UDP-N-acetylgalactosamine diphosphorylase / glucosamine-1-phosphate N-acetyltransferase / galactosamine-1-phosphate N-acetyltransferase